MSSPTTSNATTSTSVPPVTPSAVLTLQPDQKPPTIEEYNKGLAARGERLCGKCGDFKPLTSAFFHRDQYDPDGFHQVCRACRKGEVARNRQESALKRLDAITSKARGVLVSPKNTRYNAGLAEMVDLGMELWGGTEGFMQRWVEEYEAATPGGMVRTKLLIEFARLKVRAEEKMPTKSPSTMTDEELMESFQRRLEAIESAGGDDDPPE